MPYAARPIAIKSCNTPLLAPDKQWLTEAATGVIPGSQAVLASSALELCLSARARAESASPSGMQILCSPSVQPFCGKGIHVIESCAFRRIRLTSEGNPDEIWTNG
eukprot:7677511-Pyramimonas_sp.AAC.1